MVKDSQGVERQEEESGFSPAEWFLRILERWPVLLAFVVVGGLAANGIWLVLPKPYMAVASLVVNQHVEKALPNANEFEVAAFLNGEAMRLEAIAFSDDVWSMVEQRLTEKGWSPEAPAGQDLKSLVELPHPFEGTWQFVAYGRDLGSAVNLANVWSDAFVEFVMEQVNLAQERQAAGNLTGLDAAALTARSANCARLAALSSELAVYQKALDSVAPPDTASLAKSLTRLAAEIGVDESSLPSLDGPPEIVRLKAYSAALDVTLDAKVQGCQAAFRELQAQWEADLSKVGALEQTAGAVSPYLEVAVVQAARPPGTRPSASAMLLMGGSSIGLILGALVVLIWPAKPRGHRPPDREHAPE